MNIKWLVIFLVFIVLTSCQAKEHEQMEVKEIINQNIVTLPKYISEDRTWFSVQDLVLVMDGTYNFDPINRTLTMTINDDTFYLVDGIKVLERNGEYLPTDEIYLLTKEDEKVYLPNTFIEQGLGLPITYSESTIEFQWRGPVEKVGGPPEEFDFENWNVEKMVEYLSFLKKPIKGAQVSTLSGHLPGAKRAYRNGFHEGIDWYDFASGGNINIETPVYAMANGVVVRVDHDFNDYRSVIERNKDLKAAAVFGDTPEYILDRLRGRQVWVQYPNGVMNRFAHLSAIPDDIQVGDKVDAKTIIGYVGNSGTSGAINNDMTELHLHQDLLIYGELFWKPLNQEEVREVLVRIFQE